MITVTAKISQIVPFIPIRCIISLAIGFNSMPIPLILLCVVMQSKNLVMIIAADTMYVMYSIMLMPRFYVYRLLALIFGVVWQAYP